MYEKTAPVRTKNIDQIEPITPAKAIDMKRLACTPKQGGIGTSKKRRVLLIGINVPTVTFDDINKIGELYNIKVCVHYVWSGKHYGLRNPDTIKSIAANVKSMMELTRIQDEAVGDGTTPVSVLADEMLHVAEAFIDKNFHPTVICRGTMMDQLLGENKR